MGILTKVKERRPEPEVLSGRLDDAEQRFVEEVRAVEAASAQRQADIQARLQELEAEAAQITAVSRRATELQDRRYT